VVTAGPTRQYLDPVRFLSNASSGKMGYAIARAAVSAGHQVTLISGPTSLRRPRSVRFIPVVTGQQMFEAVKDALSGCDCLVMAAAVTDFAPERPFASKIKKTGRPLTVRLVPVRDILRWASRHRPEGSVIVGFALEDRQTRQRAQAKLEQKGLDMIIANSPLAIGADKVSLQVKTAGSPWLDLPLASKATQARRIVRLVEALLHSRAKKD